MSKQEKIYCGKGKRMNEKWIKATINVEKLRGHIEEYQGTKYVKLNINLLDNPDKYGKDVSIEIDTWKPDVNAQKKEYSEPKKEYYVPDVEYKSDVKVSDLPF